MHDAEQTRNIFRTPPLGRRWRVPLSVLVSVEVYSHAAHPLYILARFSGSIASSSRARMAGMGRVGVAEEQRLGVDFVAAVQKVAWRSNWVVLPGQLAEPRGAA